MSTLKNNFAAGKAVLTFKEDHVDTGSHPPVRRRHLLHSRSRPRQIGTVTARLKDFRLAPIRY